MRPHETTSVGTLTQHSSSTHSASRSRANANLEHPDIDYTGTVLAMYLLAEFREPRASGPILRLLETADEQTDFIFGDTLTEDLPAILVSVETDLASIVRLARSESLHPYARAAAASALRVAVVTGRATRAEVIGIYGEILRRELAYGEGADVEICESIVVDAMSLAGRELEREIGQLWEAGILDPSMFDEDDLALALASDPEDVLEALRLGRHNSLITDAVEACSWWSLFHEEQASGGEDWMHDSSHSVETIRYESPKRGRNDPCPCGRRETREVLRTMT